MTSCANVSDFAPAKRIDKTIKLEKPLQINEVAFLVSKNLIFTFSQDLLTSYSALE